MYLCNTPVGEMAGVYIRKRFLLYPEIEIANFSRGIETIWRSSVLYMYVYTANAVYRRYIPKRRETIVSLFISTRRLAMPYFDEWSRQVLTPFFLYYWKNIYAFSGDKRAFSKDKGGIYAVIQNYSKAV